MCPNSVDDSVVPFGIAREKATTDAALWQAAEDQRVLGSQQSTPSQSPAESRRPSGAAATADAAADASAEAGAEAITAAFAAADADALADVLTDTSPPPRRSPSSAGSPASATPAPAYMQADTRADSSDRPPQSVSPQHNAASPADALPDSPGRSPLTSNPPPANGASMPVPSPSLRASLLPSPTATPAERASRSSPNARPAPLSGTVSPDGVISGGGSLAGGEHAADAQSPTQKGAVVVHEARDEESEGGQVSESDDGFGSFENAVSPAEPSGSGVNGGDGGDKVGLAGPRDSSDGSSDGFADFEEAGGDNNVDDGKFGGFTDAAPETSTIPAEPEVRSRAQVSVPDDDSTPDFLSLPLDSYEAAASQLLLKSLQCASGTVAALSASRAELKGDKVAVCTIPSFEQLRQAAVTQLPEGGALAGGGCVIPDYQVEIQPIAWRLSKVSQPSSLCSKPYMHTYLYAPCTRAYCVYTRN